MPPTAAVRHRAEKSGLVQWPDRRVRSHTAPSPSTVTMVQPRSAIAISRPAPRPTNAPPSRHPLRHRSQIPIDSPPARHRRATPARGFLPRGFSDACRPSTRPRSSAAGIQEALTKADIALHPRQNGAQTHGLHYPIRDSQGFESVPSGRGRLLGAGAYSSGRGRLPYSNVSRSAFAAFRSAVAKPSVKRS
jgi:hypothetical protein